MKNFSYFDAHCDTALELWLNGQHLTEPTRHINLERAKNLGNYAQFFAYCTCWYDKKTPVEQYKEGLAYFKNEIAAHSDAAALCGSRAEVEAAWKQGKLAAIVAIEGAEAIDCDPGRLEEAAQDGVRMITLTWNHENALGGSHITGSGLTAQGREFVRRAQKLGIIVDLSHSSERVFYDVCEIAEKPIVASHSNSRFGKAHSRNLSDDQFRCLVALNGCAGLNLFPEFLSKRKVVGIERALRHVNRWLELGGDGNICLGGDWDGVSELPVDVDGVDSWLKLPPLLADAGISEDVIDRMTSGTLLRVMDDCGAKDLER